MEVFHQIPRKMRLCEMSPNVNWGEVKNGAMLLLVGIVGDAMTVIEMLDAVIQMPVAFSDQPMTWYICPDQDALVHVVDLQ